MFIPLIQSARSNLWMNYFILFTRLLVGFAFIPSGLTKLYHYPFTSLPVTDPVGYFFDALHRTGIYWSFLGFAQLVTAFLLMTQRWAKLGGLIFLCIMLNIWLITVGVGFGNTVYITFAMLLAGVILVLWDVESHFHLFQEFSESIRPSSPHRILPYASGYGLGLFIGLSIVCHIPYVFPAQNLSVWLYILLPFCLSSLSFLIFLRWDWKKQNRHS